MDEFMDVLVCDPLESQRLLAERRLTGGDRLDEVWDGIYLMSPLANNEHQHVAFQLGLALQAILAGAGQGEVFVGVNVSDREEDWTFNYRVPDVAVFLADNRAMDCGTHWCGGPDLAIEIVSPGDRSRKKLDFYAEVSVRELWILDRDPWKLEHYELREGVLQSQDVSTAENAKVLQSRVLPFAIRVMPGLSRPLIEITAQTSGSQERWTI